MNGVIMQRPFANLALLIGVTMLLWQLHAFQQKAGSGSSAKRLRVW